MRILQFQIITLLAWLFLVFNIERFSAPINIASFVYLFITIVAILIILAPRLRQKPIFWLFAIGFPSYFALRAYLGYPIEISRLPIIVTELCTIGITIVLVRLIGQGVDKVQEVITNFTIGDLTKDTKDFDHGQGWLYREIRRARIFQRPATLLVVSPSNKNSQNMSDYFIREIQNKILNQYVSARTANFLRKELRDCDVITQRDDQFVVLLPETDKKNLVNVIRKLKKSSREILNIDLQIGASTFPDEAVTFEGLLKLAEETLTTKGASVTVHPSCNGYSLPTHEDMVPREIQNPPPFPTKESLALKKFSIKNPENYAINYESKSGIQKKPIWKKLH